MSIYIYIYMIRISTLASESLLCVDNATQPSLNFSECISFFTPLSGLAESSATKSKSQWRWREFKTMLRARRYF